MAQILVVDDEEMVRRGLARLLSRAGHSCALAPDVAEARRALRSQTFDLVLCDIEMPGASGLDLLEQIATELVGTGTLMVTGSDDTATAARALELGAYGYVIKPFGNNEMLINVMSALRRRDLEIENRRCKEELESKLMDRNASLRRAIKQLKGDRSPTTAWQEIIHRLSHALALRDEETGRHIERVGLFSEVIARGGGCEKWLVENIRQASLLHDAGKIGIPDSVLTKPGRLTAEEREVIERHTELGFQLLSGSASPVLALAASIALTHHERWDGTGYPRALRGEDIPIEGRIVAIADVFDALTSHRVYRSAFEVDEAIAMLDTGSGTHFDPSLLGAFHEGIGQILQIRDDHPDELESPSPISVLVVEDQELLADAIERLLEASEGVEVVGRSRSLREAIEALAKTEPDIVLLDWLLPDGSGADVMREIVHAGLKTKSVVLTGMPDEAILADAIEAGCSAVMRKTSAFEEVLETIKTVNSGESGIPLSRLPSVLVRARSTPFKKPTDLTPREVEILGLLAEGLANIAIAERLVLSINTVRNHVQSIIMKLGAHSKLQAVTLALRRGLVRLPPAHLD